MAIIFFAVYGLIGGLSTLAMVLGIPAIIVWKCYRRLRYQIPLTR